MTKIVLCDYCGKELEFNIEDLKSDNSVKHIEVIETSYKVNCNVCNDIKSDSKSKCFCSDKCFKKYYNINVK